MKRYWMGGAKSRIKASKTTREQQKEFFSIRRLRSSPGEVVLKFDQNTRFKDERCVLNSKDLVQLSSWPHDGNKQHRRNFTSVSLLPGSNTSNETHKSSNINRSSLRHISTPQTPNREILVNVDSISLTGPRFNELINNDLHCESNNLFRPLGDNQSSVDASAKGLCADGSHICAPIPRQHIDSKRIPLLDYLDQVVDTDFSNHMRPTK